MRNFSFDTTSNNWKNVGGGVNKNVPTLRGIFQKLFQSCIARNFEMKSEIVSQIFLTKLDFGNLWSFWWHLWDLWHWCQWWFSSSLTKIPHNVGFLPGWIQHCEEFFKNFSNPALWGILKWKVRPFANIPHKVGFLKFFDASDDIIEIFDIDGNDDQVQAW